MRQEATLDQAAKILSVFRNTPVEQVQAIVGSGLLADLRDGNVAEVNREEFRKMLGLKASESVPPKWEVWKTLTVGGIAKEELLRRLDAEGFRVSDWARDIMGKPGFVTSAKSVDVPFARCRVSDPGFTEKPTTVELFDRNRLAGLGLDLCQPEDGPYLRLGFPEQRANDWFWMAMEPITDSDGNPNVFCIGRYEGERWLVAGWAGPGCGWVLGAEIVFRLRK